MPDDFFDKFDMAYNSVYRNLKIRRYKMIDKISIN